MLARLNFWYDKLDEPWHTVLAMCIGGGFFWLLVHSYWAAPVMIGIVIMRMVYARGHKLVIHNVIVMKKHGKTYEADFSARKWKDV